MIPRCTWGSWPPSWAAATRSRSGSRRIPFQLCERLWHRLVTTHKPSLCGSSVFCCCSRPPARTAASTSPELCAATAVCCPCPPLLSGARRCSSRRGRSLRVYPSRTSSSVLHCPVSRRVPSTTLSCPPCRCRHPSPPRPSLHSLSVLSAHKLSRLSRLSTMKRFLMTHLLFGSVANTLKHTWLLSWRRIQPTTPTCVSLEEIAATGVRPECCQWEVAIVWLQAMSWICGTPIWTMRARPSSRPRAPVEICRPLTRNPKASSKNGSTVRIVATVLPAPAAVSQGCTRGQWRQMHVCYIRKCGGGTPCGSCISLAGVRRRGTKRPCSCCEVRWRVSPLPAACP
mmetsp:Transcript_8343/g.15712  ORF Transcript_8343/g.15712 Transcript_8343/m.15712 type:complete len:342 (-) Transcript_8343:908-1933(-)